MDEPVFGETGGPVLSTGSNREIRCPRCNKVVDPLRADRVAIFDWRFHYFCSAQCRAAFVPGSSNKLADSSHLDGLAAPLERFPQRGAEPAEASSISARAITSEPTLSEPARPELPEPNAVDLEVPAREAQHTVTESSANVPESRSANSTRYDRSQTHLLLATALATFGAAGILAGSSSWILYLRCVLAIGAATALTMAERRRITSPLELDPFTTLTAPLGATVLLGIALIAERELARSIANLTLVLIAGSAASLWLVRRERRSGDLKLQYLTDRLNERSYRVDDGKPRLVAARELHPGHEIVTEPGATLPVDAQIIAGRALVEPWLESNRQEERAEGDSLVAGAKVITGRVRGIVSWAGDDRAFVRLMAATPRSAELHAAFARLGWFMSTRGGWALGGVFALGAVTADGKVLEYLALAFAALACLANPAVRQGAAMQARRIAFQLMQNGIAFKDAAALDKAGRVSTAALCARGTVLLGEPEVASIETLAAHSVEEILALAAGAETAATHPSAIAVRRAARARNIVPDAARSPDYTPGLGVTAVSASGKSLIVGNRALMLKHRVGVAVAEKRIVELESTGRSVLLVALDGHLVGVIGLQDGLRPGARAAVQHLIDVGIEPVLLSGDARETCEALGRAVDIYHIRPEVLPADRGKEIRRLTDGGAVVAVLGRSPPDDLALAAADVSIVLAAAGSTSAEWSAELASDSVRDAAYALRLAHFARRETRLALVTPVVAGLLGLLASVVTTTWVLCPLFTLAGAALFLLRYRTTLPPGATSEKIAPRARVGLSG
jgi:cation transport ATPase